jgi:N-acetylmuramoyl-L-alanine amidase
MHRLVLSAARRRGPDHLEIAMSERRIVGPGDHVVRIAHDAGFTRFESVWDHADNAELRQRRVNPCVLARGDKVAVPELRPGKREAATGSRHRFVLGRTTVELRVALRSFLRRPLANRPCTVDVDGDAQELVTDGDGVVTRPIPQDARLAVITIDDDEIELLIGYLEPIDTESGWKNRLMNLGYLLDTEDADAIELALEEFQVDHGLEVTREADDATRAALQDEHGS